MTKDSNGILSRSVVGSCTNYNPDKTKSTGVKAHDVAGLIIYECLNCEPTEKGNEIGHSCGDIMYCSKYEPKKTRM
jgi:hypothetical protein